MKPLFQPPELEADHLYTWCCDLEKFSPDIDDLAQSLSDDEKNRAATFYFEKDRKRFIVGRGVFRHLFAAYLECSPKILTFRNTDKGKPQLDSPKSAFQFNLSHSGNLIIWAMAMGQQVGVDVEQVRPLDTLKIGKDVFSETEMLQLGSYEASQQPASFFHIWTQKEAIIKLFGDGLSANYLKNFTVETNPKLMPQVVSAAFSPLWLYPLDTPKDYFACLASETNAKLVQIEIP